MSLTTKVITEEITDLNSKFNKNSDVYVKAIDDIYKKGRSSYEAIKQIVSSINRSDLMYFYYTYLTHGYYLHLKSHAIKEIEENIDKVFDELYFSKLSNYDILNMLLKDSSATNINVIFNCITLQQLESFLEFLNSNGYLEDKVRDKMLNVEHDRFFSKEAINTIVKLYDKLSVIKYKDIDEKNKKQREFIIKYDSLIKDCEQKYRDIENEILKDDSYRNIKKILSSLPEADFYEFYDYLVAKKKLIPSDKLGSYKERTISNIIAAKTYIDFFNNRK